MWIEIEVAADIKAEARSRLARALWIEIMYYGLYLFPLFVEARESLVD